MRSYLLICFRMGMGVGLGPEALNEEEGLENEEGAGLLAGL